MKTIETLDFFLGKLQFFVAFLLLLSCFGMDSRPVSWPLTTVLLSFHSLLFLVSLDCYFAHMLKYKFLSVISELGVNVDPPCGLNNETFVLNYSGFIITPMSYSSEEAVRNLNNLKKGSNEISSPDLNGKKVIVNWDENMTDECRVSVSFKGTTYVLPMSKIGRGNLISAFIKWKESRGVFARKTGNSVYHEYDLLELINLMSTTTSFNYFPVKNCVIAGEMGLFMSISTKISMVSLAVFSISPFLYGGRSFFFFFAFLSLLFPAITAAEGSLKYNSLMRFIKRKMTGTQKTPVYRYSQDTDFKWCNMNHRVELTCDSINNMHFYIMDDDLNTLPKGFIKDLSHFYLTDIDIEEAAVNEGDEKLSLTTYYYTDTGEREVVDGHYVGIRQLAVVLRIGESVISERILDLDYERLTYCNGEYFKFINSKCAGAITNVRGCIGGYNSHCMDLMDFFVNCSLGKTFKPYTTRGSLTVGDRILNADPVDYATLKSCLKLNDSIGKLIIHNNLFFTKSLGHMELNLVFDLILCNKRIYDSPGIGSGVLKRYISEFFYLAEKLKLGVKLREYQKERLPKNVDHLDKLVSEPCEKIRITMDPTSKVSELKHCDELDQISTFTFAEQKLKKCTDNLAKKADVNALKSELKKEVCEIESLLNRVGVPADSVISDPFLVSELNSKTVPLSDAFDRKTYKEVLKIPAPLLTFYVKRDFQGEKFKKPSNMTLRSEILKKERKTLEEQRKEESIKELMERREIFRLDVEKHKEMSKTMIDAETKEKYTRLSSELLVKMGSIKEVALCCLIAEGKVKAASKKLENDSRNYKIWSDKYDLFRSLIMTRDFIIRRIRSYEFTIREIDAEIEELRGNKAEGSGKVNVYKKIMKERIKKRFLTPPVNIKLANRFDPLNSYILNEDEFDSRAGEMLFAKVDSDIKNKTLRVPKKFKPKGKKPGVRSSKGKYEKIKVLDNLKDRGLINNDFFTEIRTFGSYTKYKQCNKLSSNLCLKSELVLFKDSKLENCTNRTQRTVYNRSFAVFDSLITAEPLHKKEKLEKYKSRIKNFLSSYDEMCSS